MSNIRRALGIDRGPTVGEVWAYWKRREYNGGMDTAESGAYDSYLGSMNPGPRYSGQPSVKPGDDSRAVPAVGAQVRHSKSGELGTVTGLHVHGHSGERMPTVRWEGQPSTGFTSDQGYSLDSLTNP